MSHELYMACGTNVGSHVTCSSDADCRVTCSSKPE